MNKKGGENNNLLYIAAQMKKWSIQKIAQYIKDTSKENYNDGYKDACKDIPDGSVIITPDYSYVDFDYDEFVSVVKSVKGIGEKRAIEITDKIIEYYDAKRQEEYNNK